MRKTIALFLLFISMSCIAAPLKTDSVAAIDKTIAELHEENRILQIRSNVNFLSSCMILSVVMIFFMWGIKERNRKHVMILERKNIALELANHTIQEAREFAEHESELKSIFLKNLAHEIRTPLNQIYGFAQVMADDNMPLSAEEMREMSKLVCDASAHLTKIVENTNEVTDKLSKLTKLEEVESVLKS